MYLGDVFMFGGGYGLRGYRYNIWHLVGVGVVVNWLTFIVYIRAV